jgi:PglZ domain
MSLSLGGPVSAALEADLRSSVRRHGIVVWLDLDGHYTGFVDRLVAARAEGELPYEVRVFRGSYLELLFSLEGVAGGIEKAHLVLHLPGFNEEMVRATPLYELYAAGVRYRKALDTLVGEAAAGSVRPEEIAAFKARSGMSLPSADAWLSGLLNEAEGGFAAQLRALSLPAVVDDLLSGGFVAGCVGQAFGGGAASGSIPRAPAESTKDAALWERLAAWTGMPEVWRETTLPGRVGGARPRAEDVAFVVASWALGVEYANDLARPTVSPHLATVASLLRPVSEACHGLAVHLREHHRDFYRHTAGETERLLADEVEAARAEDLGKIDTFAFEEEKVLAAALEALGQEAWDRAASYAAPRAGEAKGGEPSFWLRVDPMRMSAWQLVHDAARLGQAIARAGARLESGLGEGGSVEEAVLAYVERGALVDQAHRHLEQRRPALLQLQMREFEALRARLDGMRAAFRRWADAWTADFQAVCRKHGFLPAASYQQRTLFDEVVKPLTQEQGPTAYFVVDALRFEMGEELYRQLEGTPATTVLLRPRLAELPTVTEVGMNALAPVAQNGRLALVLVGERVKGFQMADAFRVDDPDSRRRAMHARVGGATCPWMTLEDVTSRDATSLKRSIAQARLVVVHSQEIDAAGESGAGPAAFDQAIQKLRAALRLLREAGVRRFVVTSDHGFLLLDEATAAAQAHGRRADPKRRHVFSTVAADHAGEARVPLSALGYEGASGHLMFPETTAVFDTGRRGTTFVHGGNSLQERVIPVLTIVHRAAAGGSNLVYQVRAEPRDGVAGMHCLEGRLEVVALRGLDFGSPKEIELGLRVPGEDGVQVELCQARGKARVVGAAVLASVGEPFELFFRLSGASEARVLVELFHPSAEAEVTPCVLDARFAVTASRAPASRAAPSVPPSPPSGLWLDLLPDDGSRQVFGHLAAHGTITEDEVARLMGGARAARRFANQFEALARKAPFGAHIDVVGGVKRYVREGSG